jgi:hypothetical protein
METVGAADEVNDRRDRCFCYAGRTKPSTFIVRAFRSLVSLRILEILFHRPAPSNDKRFMRSARDPIWSARRHSLVTSFCWHSPSQRSTLSHLAFRRRVEWSAIAVLRGSAAQRGYFAKIEYLHFPRCLPWRNRSSIMATTECRIASQKRVKNSPTVSPIVTCMIYAWNVMVKKAGKMLKSNFLIVHFIKIIFYEKILLTHI